MQKRSLFLPLTYCYESMLICFYKLFPVLTTTYRNLLQIEKKNEWRVQRIFRVLFIYVFFLLALCTRVSFLLLLVICCWLNFFFFQRYQGTIFFLIYSSWGLPGGSKESACKRRRLGFSPWSGKTPTCPGIAKLVCYWCCVLEHMFQDKRSHYKQQLTSHTQRKVSAATEDPGRPQRSEI